MGPQPFRLNRQGITLLSAILLGGYPIFSIFFFSSRGCLVFHFSSMQEASSSFSAQAGVGVLVKFSSEPREDANSVSPQNTCKH